MTTRRIPLALTTLILLGPLACSFDPRVEPPTSLLDAQNQQDSATSPDGRALDASSTVDATPVSDAAPAIDAVTPDCWTDPDYDQIDPLTSHRYWVVDDSFQPRSWPSASDACASSQAHLVVIDNETENQFVRGLSSVSTIWIGLHDRNDENAFEWVTGIPLGYENWNDGEPNNSGNEDCVTMRNNSEWNDEECANSRSFVCECDPQYVP